jgi:hypothetical protein
VNFFYVQTIFIRVKRKKTTYFLELEPTDTVLEAKQKLQALSDVPVDKQRLVLMKDGPTILQEAKSLAEQRVHFPLPLMYCELQKKKAEKKQTVD